MEKCTTKELSCEIDWESRSLIWGGDEEERTIKTIKKYIILKYTIQKQMATVWAITTSSISQPEAQGKYPLWKLLRNRHVEKESCCSDTHHIEWDLHLCVQYACLRLEEWNNRNRQLKRKRDRQKVRGDVWGRIYERAGVLNLVLLLLPPMPVLHNDTALAI